MKLQLLLLFLSTILWCHTTTSLANTPNPPLGSLSIPSELKEIRRGDEIFLETGSGVRGTHLIPDIQDRLNHYIKKNGNPITAVVLVEVETGNIIALSDGLAPSAWGGQQHTALHNTFPSASLFKTVVASAAIEIAHINPYERLGLIGGCSHVQAQGQWMRAVTHNSRYDMSLKRAYGHSCNGFFAKIAVNEIGLGPILAMVERFKWQKPVPADFYIPGSPFVYPDIRHASAQTMGKFAAGFGEVGSSPMHTAWRTLTIAALGHSKPLQLFRSQDQVPLSPNLKASHEQVIDEHTASTLIEMMDSTIQGGTASSAFKGRRFRRIRRDIGGKTGTLTGSAPPGLTTWFTGIYPLSNPQVVVTAVTVIEDLWIFKATNLAAEAIAAWEDYQQKRNQLASTPKPTISVN